MTDVASVSGVLSEYVGTIVARSIVQGAAHSVGTELYAMSSAQVPAYLRALEAGVNAFVADPGRARECSAKLRDLLESAGHLAEMSGVLTRMVIDINNELDIVTARNHTKTVCQDLGFSASEQVKIATAVSELARNIVLYVGSGRIELEIIDTPRRGIEVRAIDEGSGIPGIDHVFSGGYRSTTGMGVGLMGTKRLMDYFEIDTGPDKGTRIVVRKYSS
jgi:serine/threonine-protein kinase RsbT